jgi:hypothetical protein
MMKLWERSDESPHVDGAPGTAGPHPYLVLCRRHTKESVGASVPDDAPGQVPGDSDDDATFDLGDRGDHAAVVYQWVRIPG